MNDTTQAIERYKVYTRDEAAALMKMPAMEMDDLLDALDLHIVDTGRRKTYLGEVLLRAQGADLSPVPGTQYHPQEICPNVVYSASQAAQLLHIPLRTLQYLGSEGKLRPAKIGKHPVFLGKELLRFLESMTLEPKSKNKKSG